MKKALIIYGSPRKGMHSEKLANQLLDELKICKDVEKVYLMDINILPCNACDACIKGKCIINDDMKSIYKKIEEADIVIVTSPLYFNSVSAGLKALIDRCQAFYNAKKSRLSNINDKLREGYFVCSAGSPNANFDGAILVMQLFFKAINALYKENYFIDNTDNI